MSEGQLVKAVHIDFCFRFSRASLMAGFDRGLHRRPYSKSGSRLPLYSVDIDSTPPSAQTPPTVRQTRYSTADLLSNSFNSKLETDGSVSTIATH